MTDKPWETEPDKQQWVAASGLDCLIVRSTTLGALCGYVGVPREHPDYGRYFEDVDVDVHGGLTYANVCDEDNPHGICHVPEPGRPADVWWLGFDCGHAFDISPAMHARLAELGHSPYVWPDDSPLKPTYKTIEYVRAQCEDLASQLAERGRVSALPPTDGE